MKKILALLALTFASCATFVPAPSYKTIERSGETYRVYKFPFTAKYFDSISKDLLTNRRLNGDEVVMVYRGNLDGSTKLFGKYIWVTTKIKK